MKQIQFNSIDDLPELQKNGIVVDFEAMDEEIDPSDMYGGENESEKWIDDIYKVYEQTPGFIHPEWFCAKVTVIVDRGSFSDEADDYLGCCSYKSFDEFTNTKGDYYEDMILHCINQINESIENHNNEIKKAWDLRIAKRLTSKYGFYITSQKEINVI